MPEVHRLVVNRDPKFTNFVEFRNYKIIYRRYAGLFFSMVRFGRAPSLEGAVGGG